MTETAYRRGYRISLLEIEIALQSRFIWKAASKDCRILVQTAGDIKKGEEFRKEYFDWYCHMALKLKEIVTQYEGA